MFAFVPAVLSVSEKSRSQCSVFLWPFSIECTNNSTVTQSEFRGRDCVLFTRDVALVQWGWCCYSHNERNVIVLSTFPQLPLLLT